MIAHDLLRHVPPPAGTGRAGLCSARGRWRRGWQIRAGKVAKRKGGGLSGIDPSNVEAVDLGGG